MADSFEIPVRLFEVSREAQSPVTEEGFSELHTICMT